MAPTIQRPGGPGVQSKGRQQDGEDRRTDLICRVKYSNTLPDIPFDPKFIAYPFDSQRFISYNPTGLERGYKYELLTEHDLGVTIDLILPETYDPEEGVSDMLDPSDEKLLEEEFNTIHDKKRTMRHSQPLSWMRKPDYISTEQTRYQPTTIEKIESDIGFNVKKKMNMDDMYQDKDSQIRAIEKTFDDARVPIEKHHSKPNVYPVEEYHILPDSEMWKYPCAQVIFDTDPAPSGVPVLGQVEMMAQAMIRGVMDESGEQFVAYFLPTDQTLEKRRDDFRKDVDYKEEEEYEYKMAREYNWNVKSKQSKGYEENFFFLFRDDGVYYNELETRVRLSKRRLKAGQQIGNSKLIVKHRVLNKQELKMQRYRERNLEPLNEEDDDMSEDEDEEEEEQLPETRSRSGSRSKSRSRSRSRSKSRSGSRSKSRSRSKSGSRSKSRSVSRSRSRSKSKSKSRSRSKSSSRSRSRSKSRSASRSKSRSASRSKSRSRSKSGSPAARSRSSSAGSKRSSRHSSKSGSGSPRQGSASPNSSRSRSGSRSGSASD